MLLKKNKIPYFKFTYDHNINSDIKRVLKSGWLTTGPYVLKFENQFSHIVKKKYSLALNSCTSALNLACDLLNIKKDTKVFLPSLTFVSDLEVIINRGGVPVFLDVDLKSKLLTPKILEKGIKKNPGVRNLIIVHFAGRSCEMKEIKKICDKYKINIIEDCAHAFPAVYNQKTVGSYSDISCYSFYPNKTITTGDGGMLTTNNFLFYKKALSLSSHGIKSELRDRILKNRNRSWNYDFNFSGYKLRMNDIAGAIGTNQLKNYKKLHEKRVKIANYYLENLKNIKDLILPAYSKIIENDSWHLFIVRVKSKKIRNYLIDKLAEKGIGTSVHYKPLHTLSYIRKKYKKIKLANSEKIWNTSVSLPIYPGMTKNKCITICKNIKKILIK